MERGIARQLSLPEANVRVESSRGWDELENAITSHNRSSTLPCGMQRRSGYSSELRPLTILREIVHEQNIEEVLGDSMSVLKLFNLFDGNFSAPNKIKSCCDVDDCVERWTLNNGYAEWKLMQLPCFA